MSVAIIKATPWGGAIGTMNGLLSGAPTKLITAATPIVIWGHTVVEDYHPLIAVGILFGLDLITGLIRAVKRREVNSPALYRTGGKIFVYAVLVIMATQATLAADYLFFMPSIVFGYIALTELASIIENLNDLGYRIPLLNIVYKFLALRKIEDRKKSSTLSKLLVEELFTTADFDKAIEDLEAKRTVLQTKGIKALRETVKFDRPKTGLEG